MLIRLDEGNQQLVAHALGAAHGRADLLALLQKEHREAQFRRPARRCGASRSRPHHDHIVAPLQNQTLAASFHLLPFQAQRSHRTRAQTQPTVGASLVNHQSRLSQFDGPHRTEADAATAIAAPLAVNDHHISPSIATPQKTQDTNWYPVSGALLE